MLNVDNLLVCAIKGTYSSLQSYNSSEMSQKVRCRNGILLNYLENNECTLIYTMYSILLVVFQTYLCKSYKFEIDWIEAL